jgi:hypothetical protein
MITNTYYCDELSNLFFRYTGSNKKYSPFYGSIWEVVAHIDWIERIELHQSIIAVSNRIILY